MEILGSILDSVLQAPIFDERTGRLLRGVVGHGEMLLGDIVDEGGGLWWDAPACALLGVARQIDAFDEAATEVFLHLSEEMECALPELVEVVGVVLC